MSETETSNSTEVTIIPTESTNENGSKHLTKVNDEVLTESSINRINLLDEKQLAQAEVFLTRIARSEKGGIKTVNDGLAVLMRAQDLNIPFSTSLEHIHVINGKTGIDVHIIKALLLKAGVTWECIKDYAPLYEYTDSINVYNDNAIPDYCVKVKSRKEAVEKAKADIEKGIDDFIYIYPVTFYKDFNGNVYREYQLTDKFAIALNRQHANEIVKSGKIPVIRVPSIPIDYICEYKFFRKVKGKDMTVTSHFSYNDAVTANFFTKDTYKYYARILIGHRAFTYGARDIASDVLMGCYETTELKIMNGLPIDDQDIVDVTAEKVN